MKKDILQELKNIWNEVANKEEKMLMVIKLIGTIEKDLK